MLSWSLACLAFLCVSLSHQVFRTEFWSTKALPCRFRPCPEHLAFDQLNFSASFLQIVAYRAFAVSKYLTYLQIHFMDINYSYKMDSEESHNDLFKVVSQFLNLSSRNI